MAIVPEGARGGAAPALRLDLERLHVDVWGVVQGVGFRPFVHRLATRLGLTGWVLNDGAGVRMEVEGPREALLDFLAALRTEAPPAAYLYAVDHRFLPAERFPRFEIRESATSGPTRAWVLPDLGTCAACAAEIADAENRRYRYPFTNCTHCGPRFTIIEALPYDRARTAMRRFRMCPRCGEEYRAPEDRRFHAEPNACAACGPALSARDREGRDAARGEDALRLAEAWIREGRSVAVKGIGGFHLVADARNEAAAAELRRRKRRPSKAFAVMYPDLSSLRRHVAIPAYAEPFLASAQAPILLLPRTEAGLREIAPSTAPGSPYLGVFLPYTPLHRLLLADLGFPIIATSGNVTDEPIQHEDEEALRALKPLCDGFLLHDRPILRHADDSVLQLLERPKPKPQLLRRARGYVPLPILAPRPLPPLLATGGHFDATLALSRDREILVSQHLGDLDTYEARCVYERTLADFRALHGVAPEAVACDLHPDYFTTELAQRLGLPVIAVQHHHAHLAACLLENGAEGPALGVSWDGTGYGPDHTVWGGEFLLGDAREFRRVASLRPFRLPGGEAAVREPWRVAIALLDEASGEETPWSLPMFATLPHGLTGGIIAMLRHGVNAPVTTSAGRLFDGVAALLGLSYANTHQAESAQKVEYAAWRHGREAEPLPLPLVDGETAGRPPGERGLIRLDWRPLVRAVVAGMAAGRSVEALAAGFHHALVRAAVEVARRVQAPRVALTGGCFANRYLTEGMLEAFEGENVDALVHSQLPPTDGSLCVGQIWVAAGRLAA
jgi:hydrogenase maturation protein HypF